MLNGNPREEQFNYAEDKKVRTGDDFNNARHCKNSGCTKNIDGKCIAETGIYTLCQFK